MNREQQDILRHALGLGRSDREYRNHFVTGPGSTDYPHCESLVADGLMTKRPGHPLSGGDPIYTVTELGRAALAGIVLQRGPEGNLEGYVPNRCEACRATGAIHCSDPGNCGGPWDTRKTATAPCSPPPK